MDSMENITLDENEELGSFDVKALFTSILLEEAIKICEQRLRDDASLAERTKLTADTVIRFLRFCLMNSAFQYNGVHYIITGKKTELQWAHWYPQQ